MSRIIAQGRRVSVDLPSAPKPPSAQLLNGVPAAWRDAIKAAIGTAPVIGLSIGSPDPSTWRIEFAPSASADQQRQARKAIVSAVQAALKDIGPLAIGMGDPLG